MSTKITPEETSAELTLSEALKQAKEWQESAELALPAEIMTALIDGVDELRQALVDVRVLLLPDSRHDMRPSMQSITLAKERIRAALSLIEAPKETQS